ncbi:hypothetical protein BC830DRAFT_1102278 [Chytriomyces sp. MP71]|nr:hypothetical protein BC830DRAFT_1102278 [Chytriomyces sp. MP71]
MSVDPNCVSFPLPAFAAYTVVKTPSACASFCAGQSATNQLYALSYGSACCPSTGSYACFCFASAPRTPAPEPCGNCVTALGLTLPQTGTIVDAFRSSLCGTWNAFSPVAGASISGYLYNISDPGSAVKSIGSPSSSSIIGTDQQTAMSTSPTSMPSSPSNVTSSTSMIASSAASGKNSSSASSTRTISISLAITLAVFLFTS